MRDEGRAMRTRVGRAIRRVRLLRGLSQEKLAERAGASWKHVGQIERGEVNVGLDVLARIARALSVDAAELFLEPRGRRSSAVTPLVITRGQIHTIEEVLRVVKSPRSRRSHRPAE
jgi:transcriptional regulator with XRE-family HTH domain